MYFVGLKFIFKSFNCHRKKKVKWRGEETFLQHLTMEVLKIFERLHDLPKWLVEPRLTILWKITFESLCYSHRKGRGSSRTVGRAKVKRMKEMVGVATARRPWLPVATITYPPSFRNSAQPSFLDLWCRQVLLRCPQRRWAVPVPGTLSFSWQKLLSFSGCYCWAVAALYLGCDCVV